MFKSAFQRPVGTPGDFENGQRDFNCGIGLDTRNSDEYIDGWMSEYWKHQDEIEEGVTGR